MSKSRSKRDDVAADVREVELFLAFPDGVYHYVCAECTAICCRGHGLSARKEELPVLLTRYPALESLAYGREGNIVTLNTLVNTCVLLDTDNRCRIEKEFGKATKPALCNLFPFNTHKRIGRTIAVYPHFLCPLRLQVPPQPGKVEGTHAAIEPAFRSSGLFQPGYVNANVPSLPLHPSLDADEVVAREREFLASCTQAIGSTTFFDVLRRASHDSNALRSFLDRVTKVMGLPRYARSADPDWIDSTMIALASPLRLLMLTLSSEAIIRGLALIELIIRRVATLPVEPLAPHAIYKLVEEQMPGIRLMARGEEPLVIPRSTKLTPPPIGDAELTFLSFVFLRELQKSGDILGSLEKTVPKSLSGTDRTTFVHIMGRYMQHPHSHRTKASSKK